MDRLAEKIEEADPETWRTYYLKYRQLLKLIQEFPAKPPSFSPVNDLALPSSPLNDPIAQFQEMLQAELIKVNQFACVKHEEIFLGLRKLCEECARLCREKSRNAVILDQMQDRIRALGDEIMHLDGYVRLNYLGFQRLTQKFDKHLSVSGSRLFVAGLHKERFCNVRFDDILILLGLAWARLRAARSAAQPKNEGTWVPPESFVRNTAKYWIRPEMVVLLKTRILQHMPYLIFGASYADQESLLEPFALLDVGQSREEELGAFSGTLEEAQLLSSIYFDSLDGSCYQDRIHRKESARLVRFRWYGENFGEPDKEVFIERKIHHEGWNFEESVKERCVLPQETVHSFMKGRFDIDGHFKMLASQDSSAKALKSQKAMKKIADEVNTIIQERQMQPMVRTSYYRCAFQLATSNEVRISLDTQMTLLNEFQGDGHPAENWCLRGSDPIGADGVYRFPFAILEIKLQGVPETPTWLRHILAEVEAIQVHKFSKYQHGLAFLHPHRVRILPHWYQDFKDWHDKRDRIEQGKSVKSYRSDDELLDPTPALRSMLHPGGEGHMLKDMDNNDPKVIFANERVLLHYAEKGIYLGTLAVFLLRQKDIVQVMGFILMLITLGLLVFSLREYYNRLDAINSLGGAVAKNRSVRLDWMRGPLMAVLVVAMALALSTIVACANLQTSLNSGAIVAAAAPPSVAGS